MVFKNKDDHFEDIKKDTSVNRYTLGLYFKVMWHFKKYTILLALSSTITAVCVTVILPFLLSQAVDLVSQKAALTWDSSLGRLLLSSLGIVIIAAISHFMGVSSFANLDTRAQSYLRGIIFERLVYESSRFYANSMAGSLTSNAIAFVNGYFTVEELFLIKGINLVLPVVLGMGIVAVQSLPLAGLFLSISIIISIKVVVDSRYRAPFRRARRDAMSTLNGFIADVISNSAGVRANAGEDHEKATLFDKQGTWMSAAYINLIHFGRHNAVLLGSVNILQVIGVGIAAWLVTKGQVSLGLVVFAISYSQRLIASLFDLGPTLQAYQGAMADAAPMGEVLMAEHTVVDAPRALDIKVVEGTIDFESVTYQYEEDGAPILKDLSLRIPGGQHVGVVGRSGAGKTTLTHLLLRFDDLHSGKITIDRQDIEGITQRSLRRAISYVSQDSQLFHRTIRENIAYGEPDATDRQIIHAAKQAHIWELIKDLPEGLDTKVGERGVKLSGGQRQRVAIARAILKDAPLLVLDEATSALDSESEKYIQESLDMLMKKRTAIVIAHRLSTIQKMDRIIVLDKGRIVEDGTHATLLKKKKGVYASLWAHQSGGFIE
jgi:ATP-binding cassette subfamily B protein